MKLLSLVFLILGFCSQALADPWSVELSNDIFWPGGQDRNLTHRTRVAIDKWAMGMDMYSPTDKRNPDPPFGDRPWDGYSYLEYTWRKERGFADYTTLQSRIGAVGEWSGAEALQKFVHIDMGLGVPPTWAGQNPGEPTVDFVYTRTSRFYMQSVFGNTSTETNWGARVGTVMDSGFIEQVIRKQGFRYFALYAGIKGEAVFYDTHLDGRLFQDNIYTVRRNWFVATGKLGLEVYLPRRSDMFLRWEWHYETERFEGQQGRHGFNTLEFGYKF